MSKNIDIDLSNQTYIPINNYQNLPLLRIDRMDDFMQLIKDHSIDKIFLYTYNTEEIIQFSEFLVCKDWICYVKKGFGYKTIKDYFEGTKLGFDSKSKNYTLYNDKLELGEARYSGGRKITDGYLYYLAKNLGYLDYDEFEFAFKNGFYKENVPIEKFRAIKKQGFSKYSEFLSFEKSGFKKVKDYIEANKLGIEEPEIYKAYIKLKRLMVELNFKSCDQALVYAIIYDGSEKKIELDLIIKSLKTALDKFSIGDSFPKGLDLSYLDKNYRYSYRYGYKVDGEALTEDLQKNPVFLKLGKFDTKNRNFIKYIGVPLFIDGSNVAYNNGNRADGARALAKNISLVAEKAKEYNFSDIRIYHDANLEHIVLDKEVLINLRREYKVEKAPGGSDADDFIIAFAKKNEGFIVSNDRFKDHVESHPEDAEFIKNHRIAFMIDETETVVFNDDKRISNVPFISNKEIKSLLISISKITVSARRGFVELI